MADVKECFHRLKAPAWLRPFFAWPEVPARVLGLSSLNGVPLKPTDAVWPTSASMCMGFAWSLFFAQKADERLAAAAPSLRGSQLLHDRSPPLVLSEGRPRHYVYVDNLGAFARDPGVAERAVREWEADFASHGLELHGGEVLSQDIRALGCRLDGHRLRTATTPERFWKVWAASEEILRRGKFSGWALECWLGHATFVSLIQRGLSSVFHTCYRFCRTHYTDVVVLWPSVRDEIRAWKGLMIFLVHDWGRCWSELVTEGDAS